VKQDSNEVFQAYLWGQILLFSLLGASLGFFLAHRNLQTHWSLPELRLVIQTAVALAGIIVALLAGIRFTVEGRRLDLLLCTGFLVASVSTFAFSIGPVLGGESLHRPEAWAGIGGRFFAWILIAAAPFARGRSKWGQRILGNACIAACVVLLLLWVTFHSIGGNLPSLAPNGEANRRCSSPACSPHRRCSRCSPSSASGSASARKARTSTAGSAWARR